MQTIRKSRREWFGAAVFSENPGFLAFVDAAMADRLGVPPRVNLPDGLLSAPLDVHMALTNRCNLNCPGCYTSPAGDPPREMPYELAVEAIDRLAAMDVFTVAMGGGEPLLHPRLFDIAAYARSRDIAPNLTTNGLGLDAAAARRCPVFGSVHLSCHDPAELDRLAGAIARLRAERVDPGLNLLLTPAVFGALDSIVQRAARCGIRRILFLKFKLTARNRAAAGMALSPAQERGLFAAIRRLCRRWGILPMIDCSLFPAVACHAPRLRDLRFFDVNGCQGAIAYAAVTTEGKVKPCSFCDEPIGGLELLSREAWLASEPLNRFRRRTTTSACAACRYQELCNGGCRVCATQGCESPAGC